MFHVKNVKPPKTPSEKKIIFFYDFFIIDQNPVKHKQNINIYLLLSVLPTKNKLENN